MSILHTMRDSNGNVITDLVFKRSKSELRSAIGTAARTASSVATSEAFLSTGAKAGIGVEGGKMIVLLQEHS